MLRSTLLALALVFLGLATVGATARTSAASTHHSTAALVKVAKVGKLGAILVTSRGFALYQWHQERRNQIKCTGGCASTWPPLLVPANASIAKHIKGAKGTFGVVMRPGGAHQLTYQGKALYRYSADMKPGEALCQGVEGWYVFPAH